MEIFNEQYFFDKPIIDETGLKENIDINFPGRRMNKKLVIAGFRNAGFPITEEKRLLEVGVITDK